MNSTIHPRFRTTPIKTITCTCTGCRKNFECDEATPWNEVKCTHCNCTAWQYAHPANGSTAPKFFPSPKQIAMKTPLHEKILLRNMILWFQKEIAEKKLAANQRAHHRAELEIIRLRRKINTLRTLLLLTISTAGLVCSIIAYNA